MRIFVERGGGEGEGWAGKEGRVRLVYDCDGGFRDDGIVNAAGGFGELGIHGIEPRIGAQSKPKCDLGPVALVVDTFLLTIAVSEFHPRFWLRLLWRS